MSDAESQTQTPGLGHNNPPLARNISLEEADFAQVVTGFLEDEYRKQPTAAQALLDEATALMRGPDGAILDIVDDDMKGKVTSLIKRMRDLAKDLDAFHSKEKQPYLRGGQGVDQFFFGWIDKLSRRDKKNRAGAADILNQKLTEYDDRVLAEARAKAAREAAERARIAREAQEKADAARREEERLRQVAADTAAAAERARNPERKEEKAVVAQETRAEVAVQGVQTDAAKVDAEVAAARATDAYIETLRSSADIMRNRGQDGTLSTVGTEKYAEITDRTKLDLALLAPYIKLEALQSALTQWAKFTDYNTQMPGTAIGRRNKSLVR